MLATVKARDVVEVASLATFSIGVHKSHSVGFDDISGRTLWLAPLQDVVCFVQGSRVIISPIEETISEVR
jgi:hypothetical protein